MAAKMLAFDAEARKSLLEGVTKLSPRRQGDARPARPQCRHRQRLGRSDHHQRRRHRRRGSRAERQVREHRRQAREGSRAAKRPTSPATAPRRRPCWPRRSSRKAIAASPPAPTRWRWPAASARRSMRSSRICKKQSKPIDAPQGRHRQRRVHLRQQRPRDRQDHGRRVHDESARTASSPSKKARRLETVRRCRRRHAVRSRLSLAQLHHQS